MIFLEPVEYIRFRLADAVKNRGVYPDPTSNKQRYKNAEHIETSLLKACVVSLFEGCREQCRSCRHSSRSSTLHFKCLLPKAPVELNLSSGLF